MVNKVFEEQIRRIMEVYIDDMFVMSLRCADHLQHLNEALDRLRKYKVQLNLENVSSKWSLESSWGFWSLSGEANPDQISAS